MRRVLVCSCCWAAAALLLVTVLGTGLAQQAGAVSAGGSFSPRMLFQGHDGVDLAVGDELTALRYGARHGAEAIRDMGPPTGPSETTTAESVRAAAEPTVAAAAPTRSAARGGRERGPQRAGVAEIARRAAATVRDSARATVRTQVRKTTRTVKQAPRPVVAAAHQARPEPAAARKRVVHVRVPKLRPAAPKAAPARRGTAKESTRTVTRPIRSVVTKAGPATKPAPRAAKAAKPAKAAKAAKAKRGAHRSDARSKKGRGNSRR